MGLAEGRSARLKPQSGRSRCYRIHAVSYALPRASFPLGLVFGILALNFAISGRFEVGLVSHDGMKNDCEASGQSHARLSHRRPGGDCQRP